MGHVNDMELLGGGYDVLTRLRGSGYYPVAADREVVDSGLMLPYGEYDVFSLKQRNDGFAFLLLSEPYVTQNGQSNQYCGLVITADKPATCQAAAIMESVIDCSTGLPIARNGYPLDAIQFKYGEKDTFGPMIRPHNLLSISGDGDVILLMATPYIRCVYKAGNRPAVFELTDVLQKPGSRGNHTIGFSPIASVINGTCGHNGVLESDDFRCITDNTSGISYPIRVLKFGQDIYDFPREIYFRTSVGALLESIMNAEVDTTIVTLIQNARRVLSDLEILSRLSEHVSLTASKLHSDLIW